MGVVSGRRVFGTGVRVAAAVAVAMLGLAALGQARGQAEPAAPPPVVGPVAEGDDVRATVDVTQEDDVYDLSPGMDYKARMAWSSTEEVTQGRRVLGVEGGGTYIAAVNATTNPGFPCDPTSYSLSSSGEVSDSTPLTFRFVPKDLKRPGKGLAGWFIHTPTALWKGTLSVTKPGDGLCGESYTQEGGSWFAARAYAGGSEKAGGAPMPAPTVKVQPNGDVRISGSAVSASPAGRQVVKFTIVCSSPQACFGKKVPPPPPDKKLGIGYRFLGARCIPGPAGTFRMEVRMRMIADNGDTSLLATTFATGMEAGARLETTTPGLQFTRPWRVKAKRGLVINRRYAEDFTIVTDNVSAAAEWRLRLRYKWEIPARRDITHEVLGARPVVSCATS
jgi:hypothetical protein